MIPPADPTKSNPTEPRVTRTSPTKPLPLVRRLALFAVFVTLAAACSSSGGGTASTQVSGDVQNGFTHVFADFDGGTATVEQLATGRPVVLNFFASTCAPCVRELPEFESVHQDVDADVAFVGLATDGDRPEDAADLLTATGVTFPVGLDTPSSDFLKHYDGLGMPTTVFIRADGSVAESWTGVLDEGTLRSKIDEFLR